MYHSVYFTGLSTSNFPVHLCYKITCQIFIIYLFGGHIHSRSLSLPPRREQSWVSVWIISYLIIFKRFPLFWWISQLSSSVLLLLKCFTSPWHVRPLPVFIDAIPHSGDPRNYHGPQLLWNQVISVNVFCRARTKVIIASQIQQVLYGSDTFVCNEWFWESLEPVLGKFTTII